MRRWEARLARLEEFARWLVRRREEKRTEPQRIAKWMAWLQQQRQPARVPAHAPAPPLMPKRDSCRPERANSCRPEAQPKDLTLRQGPVATLDPSLGAPSFARAYSGRQEQGPSPDAPSNSCRPEPSGEGPNVPTGPLVEPLGPSLRSGRQEPPPPPPRPIVEFIQERAGMSIAIDTRTGQMADSATVMAALTKR